MRGLRTPGFTTPSVHQVSKPWPWWILLLLPILVLPLMALRGAQSPTIAALPACTSQADPHTTIIVFDVSDSVIDSGGADSKGRSFDEARLLARALANTPCTDDDRLGSVVFADTSVEIPPIRLSSLSVIESVLVRPPEHEIGGGTNLLEALELVRDMADRYPDHEVTVVVLSDMEVGGDPAVAEVLAELGGHHLHLVALGLYDPRYDQAFETVTQLDAVHAGDVADALAAAITHTRKESP